MTDTIRALCAELVDIITAHANPDDYAVGDIAEMLARARAALAKADEPAVPEGRKPAAVTGKPSDEELLEMWHGSDWFNEGSTLREFCSISRAVLARWGNPVPAPPADGEVAELVAWLYQLADKRSCNRRRGIRPHPSALTRAAVLLQWQQQVLASVGDALIKAECALSDISEGEHNLISADALQWAERRCADTLAIIRPTMRQHKIRTSECPPEPAHALPLPLPEVSNG